MNLVINDGHRDEKEMKFGNVILIFIVILINGNCSVFGHVVSVKTSKGIVEGYTLDDISVFEGIPYAKPPLGQLRFKAPSEPIDWSTPLQTKSFRPICSQMMTAYSAQMNIAGPVSEDCLYLNVYTPLLHTGPVLPVMLWIHGGGYVQGSASQTPSPGIVSNLASRGVIVITFNYRLDVLGFFSTDSDDVPDNIALLDQLAVLKWIQREIEYFGGNWNDVTLFGYSAGASSASAHLYSPLSQGLFHKAIFQSGSALAPWVWSDTDQDSNLRISIETAKRLRCRNKEKLKKSEMRKVLDCLRSVAVEVLLEASWEASNELGLGWRLTVGGSEGFLPLPPDQLAMEKREQVPVIIGTTRDETLFTAAPSVVIYGHEQNITRSLFIDAVQNLARVYFKENERPAVQALLEHEYGEGEDKVDGPDDLTWLNKTVQMQSGFSFYAPAVLEAQLLLSAGQGPVYLYSLDYVSNGFPWATEFTGVPHGQDMFYVFDTSIGNVGWKFTEEERGIVNLLGKMWTNFAKSGNPNYPTSLGFNWTPVSQKDRLSYLSINTPHTGMSQQPYHWKAARVYNVLLPRVLSSIQPVLKHIPAQSDHPQGQNGPPVQYEYELRTNQFFISTWALLAALTGVLMTIFVFSICHWNSPPDPKLIAYHTPPMFGLPAYPGPLYTLPCPMVYAGHQQQAHPIAKRRSRSKQGKDRHPGTPIS